jgi:hypothetical protein
MTPDREKTTVPIPIPPPVFYEDYDDLTVVKIIENELENNNYETARYAIKILENRRHKKRKTKN